MIWGVLAVLAILASGFKYIKSVIEGQTRPSLAAMLVFVTSLGSALVSSYVLEVRPSILFTIFTNLVLNGVVLWLVIWKNLGHTEITRFERGSLIVLGVGLAMWWLSGNPWVALVVPALVDTTGLTLVMLKLRRDPGSEDVFAWIMASFAYGCSLASLSAATSQDLIYASINFIR